MMKRIMNWLIIYVLIVGMLPVGTISVFADTAQKAYEMIIEPTLVYEVVYGFDNGISPVKAKNGKWGAINVKGEEIIECKYSGVYPISENSILVAEDTNIENKYNWYMLDDGGSILYTYGLHYLIEYCSDNVLGIREDESGWTYDEYIDFKGNVIESYIGFGHQLSFVEGSLYGGKYYLTKYRIGDKTIPIVVDTISGNIIRKYEGYTDMWVSADDTKLIGKNADGKYVEIDSGSLSVTKEYKEYTQLWKSIYDSSILFGETEEGDYVMLNTQNQVLHNYGKESIKELFEGYLQQGTTIIKYSGEIVLENFEYDVVYDEVKPSVSLDENECFRVCKREWNNVEEHMEYTYYLMDLQGNIIEDYGKELPNSFVNGYVFENGTFGKIGGGSERIIYDECPIIGDITILWSNGWKIIDTRTDKIISIDPYYSYIRGYQSVFDQYSGQAGLLVDNEKYSNLFFVFNGRENINKIFYIKSYRTDVNIIYRDISLFENGEIEAIGEFDKKEGYLPIKRNGKWGVIQIIPEEKQYTDKELNSSGDDIPSEDIKYPMKKEEQVSEAPKENISQKRNVLTRVSVSVPQNSKISKTKAGKKKVTLTFKKIKGVKGYLVQYSRKKNFKGAKKKYTKSTKVTIKKLRSKKTYYFRVKAYKLDGKKKVLSKKWSKVKKVKVK